MADIADNASGCSAETAPAVEVHREVRADGSMVLATSTHLQPYPHRLTASLQHWASQTPGKVFISQKDSNGGWRSLTYAEALRRVKPVAQALLNYGLTADKPLVVLSGNSIEHALVALAALHVGIPYSAVSPAYALRSKDHSRLQQIINLLKPGLLFVQDAHEFEAALNAVAGALPVVAVTKGPAVRAVTLLDQLEQTVCVDVDAAFNAIEPATIAKILFTSGSTGLPKGVINTHDNIAANWQQLTQTFPCLKDELVIVDWLPWSHTYGGNHNFGAVLFNGGTLFIDNGNPTPAGMAATIDNLREIAPTVYFSVPKGFEALLPYLKNDHSLAEHFFSRLKMLFYAGASLAQHIWDEWEALSLAVTGRKILIANGLGCTESCPSALFNSAPGGFAGLVGLPAPGLTLKLAPADEKFEARYKGPNIFPGYWQRPDLTAAAFDDEGFYCSGDMLRFADAKDAANGLVFAGRIAEDFKLNTGTWVRVGLLRTAIIAAGEGLIQEVVLTGQDRDFIGAILFPAVEMGKQLTGMDDREAMGEHPLIKRKLQHLLNTLAQQSTGSASYIKRAVLATFDLSATRGEISDKGSVNQRAVIQNHPELLNELYQPVPPAHVVQAQR